MNDKTVFLIKPKPPESREPWQDRAEAIERCLKRIVPEARVVHEKDFTLTDGQVEKLYPSALARLRSRSPEYADRMVSYMTSGQVRLLVLEGPGVCAKVRSAVGPTDPAVAPEGTVRNLFGLRPPNPMFMNAVHASDDPDEASRELFILDPIAWIALFY